MKPWFEKELEEADILKFPDPKAKVIRMPNVQSYPDFITGVQDLQAKQKDGAISQETYDKLYAELIHRFMKKESKKHFPAEGEASLCGVIVEAINENGLANKIDHFIFGGHLKNTN